MSIKIKGYIQDELTTRFENVKECAVVSMRGISGVDNNRIRGELLAKGIHLAVVKNSIAARAFEKLGMGAIKQVLNGPCTIVYGGENIVDLAKLLVTYDKKIKEFEIKGGFLEGQALNAEQAKALAKMPSRIELQGRIVSMAMSPGAKLAGAITGPASYIAGCIKTIADKKETA